MSVQPVPFINGPNHYAFRIANGNEFYFSYKTLVAAKIGSRFVRTSKKWSCTTSKHLTIMGAGGWEQISQEELEALS
jgi:hypothetical protein